MKFGIFYEHQLPRPWNEGDEHEAVPGRARPGRTRRQARHRLCLGSRASLSRGIFAFLGAGDVPRRLLAAHQEHPARPRHLLMPPEYNHPARVAERIATLDLVSNGRVEFGTGESASLLELGGYQACRSGREARMWREARRAVRQHDGDGPLSRLQGRVLRDAVPQRGAEAGAEAAPAAVGRLLQPRDHQAGGAAAASAR